MVIFFPGAPSGSLSISEAILCPGQPPPRCCPDGCPCLHGLCSLAASCTQISALCKQAKNTVVLLL